MRFAEVLYPVTSGIIAVNTVIFLLIRLHLLRVAALGSSYELSIQKKQYYRIITSAFTQSAFMHFAMNMASLYNIGSVLESVLGSAIFAIFYAVFVLLGGLISARLKKRHDPEIRSIGASGAICSLLGIYIVLIFTTYGLQGVSSVLPTLVMLGAMTFSKRIDSIGHFVGLFLGIFTGIVYIILPQIL